MAAPVSNIAPANNRELAGIKDLQQHAIPCVCMQAQHYQLSFKPWGSQPIINSCTPAFTVLALRILRR